MKGVPSIRLLPVVVIAASALLILKTVGLVTGDGYALSGVPLVLAQEAPPQGPESFTPDQLAAAEAAADALFGAPAEGGLPRPATPDLGADLISLGANATERAILERLTERRAELDAFAEVLAGRLALVEAAELRIEERMAELAAVEARINALVDAREADEQAQFAGLVAMYEAMRPADAATIFDRLDMAVLTRVGRAMNPRRLGPILARMQPARAEQLTVALARTEAEADPGLLGGDFADLPQIVGE